MLLTSLGPTPQGRLPLPAPLNSQPSTAGLCPNSRLSLQLGFLSPGPRGAGRQGLGLSRRGPLTWAWLDVWTRTGRAKLPGAGKHASQDSSWLRRKGTPGSLSLWSGVIFWGAGMVWSSGHPSLAGLAERQEEPRRARPGDRQGWPEAQRGGAGVHRPGARGPLGPLSGHNVLDCSTAWLADREQWLAEGSGRQPNVGGAAWPERRLVLTTCPATLGKERTSLSGRQAGGLAPCGDLSNPSLPWALMAPCHPQPLSLELSSPRI